MTDLANRLALACRLAGLPEPEREHHFARLALGRRWRFDLAWPAKMLAVECDGGTFARGRHSRGAGQALDAEKQNAAVLLGWRLLRFTTRDLSSRHIGAAVDVIRAALVDGADLPARMMGASRR